MNIVTTCLSHQTRGQRAKAKTSMRWVVMRCGCPRVPPKPKTRSHRHLPFDFFSLQSCIFYLARDSRSCVEYVYLPSDRDKEYSNTKASLRRAPLIKVGETDCQISRRRYCTRSPYSPEPCQLWCRTCTQELCSTLCRWHCLLISPLRTTDPYTYKYFTCPPQKSGAP